MQKESRNDTVPMTVLRGGRALQIDVSVASIRTLLVSALNGAYLSYFVYRLVVFLYAKGC